MMLRGRFGRGGTTPGESTTRGQSLFEGSSLVPPDNNEDTSGRVARRQPATPIYEGGGPFKLERGEPPKILRDKLYDRMVDWAFHGLAEFDDWMPEREWVKAMLDLIYHGFAFDRLGAKLRLRKRVSGEPRQSVVELLSGITLPDRIAVDGQDADLPGAGEPDTTNDDSSNPGFDPTANDAEEDIPENEAMAFDVERKLVVSATEYVTDTCSILARKGAGKTYLAMLIAEMFLASEFEIPFVVIDPTGCWYGLAVMADGNPSPNRIVVFGGEHGHRPLVSTSGRVLARLAVNMRIAMVLDLSLLPAEEQHRFVADLASELYLRNREAMHVFIDEVDIFAPQKLDGGSKHQKRCLVALDNLTRRGRFRGIGDTLISQRPAVVNKNLLSQVGTMFFLQMIAPQDLDAAMSWLHDNIRGDIKRDCRMNLPVLGKGSAYYMHGGEKSVFRRFKVKPKETFDSSYTPKMGEEAVVPKLSVLSDDDVKEIDEFLTNEIASETARALIEAEKDRLGVDDE